MTVSYAVYVQYLRIPSCKKVVNCFMIIHICRYVTYWLSDGASYAARENHRHRGITFPISTS